jgi:predicted nucleic acid-binding protein
VAQLWSEFAIADTEVIAPTLLTCELANALHQQWRAGQLDQAAARGLLDVAQALPIELHGDEQLHVRALELAVEHRLPATYDAHYLALAERFRVPLWTCDGRLVGTVRERLPWVHLVP